MVLPEGHRPPKSLGPQIVFIKQTGEEMEAAGSKELSQNSSEQVSLPMESH